MAPRRITRPVEDVVEEQVEEQAEPVPAEEAVPPAEEEDGGGEAEDSDLEDETPLTLEELDPNMALWEGGPTVTDALAMKAEWGEIYMTSATFTDHFLWRPLMRTEYRTVMRQVEELTNSGQIAQSDIAMSQEELITEICLLFPRLSVEEFAGKLAGIPSLLAQQILEMSGFVSIDTRGL